jgi:hypothetical protein
MEDPADGDLTGEDGRATEGTFLVTHAEADSAVLRDVESGQVHTLVDNPGLEAGDLLAASIAPEPPLEVAWRVLEVADRWTVSVERSPEPPTARALETAADQPVGDVTRHERAGQGEVHVLTVSPGGTEAAASDVIDDEATVERAGRLGVDRVELRTDDEQGVVSVRYLP